MEGGGGGGGGGGGVRCLSVGGRRFLIPDAAWTAVSAREPQSILCAMERGPWQESAAAAGGAPTATQAAAGRDGPAPAAEHLSFQLSAGDGDTMVVVTVENETDSGGATGMSFPSQSPEAFVWVLEYLISGFLPPQAEPEAVLRVCEFFQFTHLFPGTIEAESARFDAALLKFMVQNKVPLNLQEVTIVGEDLRQVNLDGADCSHATLCGSILPAAENITLTGTNLFRAVFVARYTDGFNRMVGNARNAKIWHTKFQGLTLMELELESASIHKAHFTGCVLHGVRFDGVNFSGCDFSNSSLLSCTLANCNFTGATVRSTRFIECTFINCTFTEACLAESSIRKCQLEGSTFARANLVSAEIDESSIKNTDMSNTVLMRAKIMNTEINAVDFSHSVFLDAALLAVTGEGPNFSHAFIISTALHQCELPAANFDNTQMINSFVFRSHLVRASFRGALIRNSLLSLTILSQVAFIGADIRRGLFLPLEFYSSTSQHEFRTSIFYWIQPEYAMQGTSFEGSVLVDCRFGLGRSHVIDDVLWCDLLERFCTEPAPIPESMFTRLKALSMEMSPTDQEQLQSQLSRLAFRLLNNIPRVNVPVDGTTGERARAEGQEIYFHYEGTGEDGYVNTTDLIQRECRVYMRNVCFDNVKAIRCSFGHCTMHNVTARNALLEWVHSWYGELQSCDMSMATITEARPSRRRDLELNETTSSSANADGDDDDVEEEDDEDDGDNNVDENFDGDNDDYRERQGAQDGGKAKGSGGGGGGGGGGGTDEEGSRSVPSSAADSRSATAPTAATPEGSTSVSAIATATTTAAASDGATADTDVLDEDAVDESEEGQMRLAALEKNPSFSIVDEVKFDGASLDQWQFGLVTQSSFANATVDGSTFQECGHVVFDNASMCSAKLLSGCVVSSFRGADLQQCKIGTRLYECVFEQAHLYGARFLKPYADPTPSFDEVLQSLGLTANLTVALASEEESKAAMALAAASSRRAVQCSFVSSILRTAVMKHVHFESCSFAGADLVGQSWTGVCLAGEGTCVEGANFTNADLRRMRHFEADLFHNTNTTRASLPPQTSKAGASEASATAAGTAAGGASAAGPPGGKEAARDRAGPGAAGAGAGGDEEDEEGMMDDDDDVAARADGRARLTQRLSTKFGDWFGGVRVRRPRKFLLKTRRGPDDTIVASAIVTPDEPKPAKEQRSGASPPPTAAQDAPSSASARATPAGSAGGATNAATSPPAGSKERSGKANGLSGSSSSPSLSNLAEEYAKRKQEVDPRAKETVSAVPVNGRGEAPVAAAAAAPADGDAVAIASTAQSVGTTSTAVQPVAKARGRAQISARAPRVRSTVIADSAAAASGGKERRAQRGERRRANDHVTEHNEDPEARSAEGTKGLGPVDSVSASLAAAAAAADPNTVSGWAWSSLMTAFYGKPPMSHDGEKAEGNSNAAQSTQPGRGGQSSARARAADRTGEQRARGGGGGGGGAPEDEEERQRRLKAKKRKKRMQQRRLQEQQQQQSEQKRSAGARS